jgi:cation diffusion facilitator family transporter
LEADATHLMTDVWTSIGVLVAIGLVALTGWDRLDPIIALLVAANIVWSGVGLMRRSVLGLMDTALPLEQRDAIRAIQSKYASQGLQFHALRTRQSGAHAFISMHVLVPGDWTVQRGHQLIERLELEVRHAVPNVTVFTHLEPLDDPTSWQDAQLDRSDENVEQEASRG